MYYNLNFLVFIVVEIEISYGFFRNWRFVNIDFCSRDLDWFVFGELGFLFVSFGLVRVIWTSS